MGKLGEIQQEKVSDLVPYAKNARVHDESQVELIAKSIEEFGFLNPVLIDKDKNVIAGHGRIMAAKKLGMETVPALYVEGLTEEQRRAYILADNRLTEIGGWDMFTVEEEYKELQAAGFDVSLTGFDFDIEGGGAARRRGRRQSGQSTAGKPRLRQRDLRLRNGLGAVH